jgi:acyl transferase domain-containing protein/acyl-CoA synthetase (AMP-forming)/AMP-acid ligase II/acyl carrier protein/NADP-dependent 3-hydroxy acid dehydrogenase YdfG
MEGTLVDLIKGSAQNSDNGYVFISGEKDEEFISYREVYHFSLGMLGNLQKGGLKKGDELVFQIEDNKSFIVVFWACILGGIIPVPVIVGNTNEHKLTLLQIWDFMNNPSLICDLKYRDALHKYVLENYGQEKWQCFEQKIFVLEELEDSAKSGELCDVKEEDIALVQFSSGSTGIPKGVMLTHTNIITNVTAIINRMESVKEDVVLSWLPLTHAMGMIMLHLMAVGAGCRLMLMDLQLFTRIPELWMSKVSEHRATLLASPNFGYKHFLSSYKREKNHIWDLSHVRAILNGAEPISYDIYKTFLEELTVYGIKNSVMRTAYGLSEATVGVSMTPMNEDSVVVYVDRNHLAMEGKVRYVDKNDKDCIKFMEVGPAFDFTEITIRDKKGRIVGDDIIGRVFVEGKNVTKGYYNNQQATDQVLEKDGCLETGDLGFLRNGRLVITGREKEIIIINGQNFYPHDLERVAEEVKGVQAGQVLVSGIQNSEIGSDKIIVFVLFEHRIEDFVPLALEIKSHLNETGGWNISDIIPVKKIHKTSSGKMQRNKMGSMYENGEFKEISARLKDLVQKRQERNSLNTSSRKTETAFEIAAVCREILNYPLVTISDRFFDIGASSLDLMRIVERLETEFGHKISVTDIFTYPRISELAEFIDRCYFNTSLNIQSDSGADILQQQGLHDIAVVGMAGYFGGARELGVFWENIKNQTSVIKEIPEDHFDYKPWFTKDTNAFDKMYCKWGTFIDDVDKFDAAFFNISPREAKMMDPQLRLLLQVMYEAAEDGGYAKKIRGSKTGVYTGVCYHDYQQRLISSADPHSGTGNLTSMLSNRPSYYFDLKGPSISIDTACSSSLVALHTACNALQNGQIDMAFATGTNLILDSWHYRYMCSIGALSPTGRCHTFDSKADGYLPGECVAAVLLKPLAHAVRDGDRIYAVIKGSAVNHGGHTPSVTAPSTSQEMQVIVDAWKDAAVSPNTISYIEAHGTGTLLGDPIEIKAIANAFESFGAINGKCAMGSAKTNIGHTEAAAGIAGLIKTILAMNDKVIPPLNGLEEMNPYLSLEGTPLYINKELIPWESYDGVPRRAGINSFGFGGTYAHVVLEEFQSQTKSYQGPAQAYILPLSAKTPEALKSYALRMASYLGGFSHKTQESQSKNADVEKTMIEIISKITSTCVKNITPGDLIEEFGLGVSGIKILTSKISSKWDIDFSEDMLLNFDEIGDLSKFISNEVNARHNVRANVSPVPYSLRDIAYTLQTGREEMEERLAVVAENIDDFVSALQRYADGEFFDDVLVCSSIRSEDIPDSQSYPGNYNEFEKVARDWVQGKKTDWSLLQTGDERPNLVSLSHYPFARERYWVEEQNKDRVQDVKEDELHYFIPAFKSDSCANNCSDRCFSGNVLLFGTDNTPPGICSGSNTNVIFIKSGDIYRSHNDGSYTIHPSNAGHYINVFQDLKSKDQDIQTIVDLRIYEIVNSEDHLTAENCGFYLSKTFFPIFNVLQAISKTGMKIPARFISFYKGGYNSLNPVMESLHGFEKSTSFIFPQMEFKAVGITQNGSLDTILASELSRISSLSDEEVCYRGDIRYVKKYEPAVFDHTLPGIIRSGGVYFITGGLGGLGYIFAKHLNQKYGAKIVLSGRSVLDAGRQNRLDELNQGGGEAIYIKADVADTKEMLQAFVQAKERFGEINGIIHAAGVFDNRTLLDQSIEDARSLLQPKVAGTLVLDKVSAAEELDFFVVFSSVSAILGDMGQCDYSAANRFQDAFIDLREGQRVKKQRSGKSISINWPLWKDGDMHLNESQEAAYLKSSGQKYLEIQNGIAAFEQILKSNYSQVIIFSGDRDKINAFLGTDMKQSVRKQTSDTALFSSQSSTDKSLEQTIKHELRGIAANILATDIDKLSSECNFGDYGFDSITLKEYANALNNRFNIYLTPAVFYSHGTFSRLSTYMTEQFGDQLRNADTQNKLGGRGNNDESQPPQLSQVNSKEGLTDKQPIAIIGINGRFPGSEDMEQFWKHLETQSDLISEIPKDRWDWEKHNIIDQPNGSKAAFKWGGFINDVDKFDAGFFNISPREAELMDPQQRLFLETVWGAIEDAGYQASLLEGRKVGVFTGVQFNDYQDLLIRSGQKHAQIAAGTAHSMISNRVSYYFNLRGASETIDTACSSSLVAIHRAVQSIQRGESELAVAGGVSLMLSPETYKTVAYLNVLSPDGRCRSFDQAANGYVRGEGVGAIILKPLDKAIADRDHIYAVIKGTAENHGGRANTLTSPNPDAQAELIVSAFTEAEVDISNISFIEAHGTGTELGDPIEINGLRMAFEQYSNKTKQYTNKKHYCGIGSVKTNIGHLEPAAGIASIFKILLSMKHEKMPGNANFNKLNPYIQIEDSPFYILNQTQNWIRQNNTDGESLPYTAGISSFGFGGANAHIVLQEHRTLMREAAAGPNKPKVFLFSAKNEQVLKTYVANILAFIEQNTVSINMKDFAYTLAVGREAMTHRLAVVASDLPQLCNRLRAFLDGNEEKNTYYSPPCKPIGYDGKEPIPQPVDSLQPEELAREWVCGLNIMWEQYYQEDELYRMPLPTYPFERNRYWISAENEHREEKQATASLTGLPSEKRLKTTEKNWKALSWAASGFGKTDSNVVSMEIVDGCIAVVKMEDIQNANMFTDELYGGLIAKFQEIHANDDIKAVIVTGYKNVFSMGGTQDVLMDISQQNMRCSDADFIYRGLLECKVPVISAIQGHAVGGGLIFGMFADIIVMNVQAVYSANFTQYGFTPGVGSTYILKEKLGNALANEMMYTAKSFSGEDLKSRNASLIFCEPDSVGSEALSIARMLSKKPMQTLRALKHELSGRILRELVEVIDSELAMHEETFSNLDTSSLIDRYFINRESKDQKKDEHGQVRIKLQTKVTNPAEVVYSQEQPCSIAFETVKETLVDMLTVLSHMGKEEIDDETTFRDIGIDSISSVELIRDINKKFKLTLEAITLYKYPTIDALTVCIFDELKLKSPVWQEDTRASQVMAGDVFGTDTSYVLSELSGIIKSSLHLNEEIDSEVSFRDLGVDSIAGVELIRDVNKAFGTGLEAIALYDYPTVTSLAGYVYQEFKNKIPKQEVLDIPSNNTENKKENALKMLKKLQLKQVDMHEAESFFRDLK